jgi:hypothetical protein
MYKTYKPKSSVPDRHLSPQIKNRFRFWLGLSLVFALIFGIDNINLAFSDRYLIQDDARQHIFWMQKFVDRELFKNDLIADYFQSVAPLGFTSLYQFFVSLGISPFIFNKILPLFLGLITTGYSFAICIEIIPVPLAAFLSTLFLNQNLWLMDSLSSGTPRSFVYPIFLAFIYYLLKKSLFLCLLTIVIEASFYPQLIFISIILLILQLFSWKNKTIVLLKENIFLVTSSLCVAIVSLLIYAPNSAKFAPILSADVAKNLPELAEGGRTAFFLHDRLFFWLLAPRSGFFPHEWLYAWSYISICVFFCCLGLFLIWLDRRFGWFPLCRKIEGRSFIFWQVIVASLIAFSIAHLYLFKFHLPSRYTQHSIRLLMAWGDGIVVAILLQPIFKALSKNIWKSSKIKTLTIVLSILIFFIPVYVAKANAQYLEAIGFLQGKAPLLYQFLSDRPKDSVIASLSEEADFIPSLAHRSVLVSEEYSIPYHQGYYRQIRKRTQDLIAAQYSQNLQEIQEFIQRYRINLWLLDRSAFETSYLEQNKWIQQFNREAKQAIENLSSDREPIVKQMQSRCQVFEDKNLVLLDTSCLLKSQQ